MYEFSYAVQYKALCILLRSHFLSVTVQPTITSALFLSFAAFFSIPSCNIYFQRIVSISSCLFSVNVFFNCIFFVNESSFYSQNRGTSCSRSLNSKYQFVALVFSQKSYPQCQNYCLSTFVTPIIVFRSHVL